MHVPEDTLDVADLVNPFANAEPPASPLLSSERVDFLAPVPIGIDTRGMPVTVPLAGSCLLIAGAVRSGISSAARHLAAAAILDPSVDLAVFDGLDMGDFDQFKPLAAYFARGTEPCASATVAESLGEMTAEIETRCEQLARTMNTAEFRPCLIVVAEAERYLLDNTRAPEIFDALLAIARRGRRAGYGLVLTTHQPTRLARELHTAIGHRLALYTTDAHNSAATLGATRRELGFDATDLPRQPGTGILRTGSRAQLLRGYHLTDDEIDLIAATDTARGRGQHPAD